MIPSWHDVRRVLGAAGLCAATLAACGTSGEPLDDGRDCVRGSVSACLGGRSRGSGLGEEPSLGAPEGLGEERPGELVLDPAWTGGGGSGEADGGVGEPGGTGLGAAREPAPADPGDDTPASVVEAECAVACANVLLCYGDGASLDRASCDRLCRESFTRRVRQCFGATSCEQLEDCSRHFPER